MLDFKQQIQLDAIADCVIAGNYTLEQALKRAYELGVASVHDRIVDLIALKGLHPKSNNIT